MLKSKTFKPVFDASEVFDAVQKKYGVDVEGQFNEKYCPPQDGAILFGTFDPEEEEWEDLEEYEHWVSDILTTDGGLYNGQSCYIHFSY